MALLATTLGCVAWWVLEQDRQLATQRVAERQDTAADLAVATLEKRLSDIDQALSHMLTDGTATPSVPFEGTIFVQFGPGSVRAWPDQALVYYPIAVDSSEAPDGLFAVPDELEFQSGDYTGAITHLRRLATSHDPRVRAAALVRLSRNLLKNGDPAEALASSQQLAALGPVTIGGLSAHLAGGLGSLYVHAQQDERSTLIAAGRELDRDLNSGRWKISSASYVSLQDELRRVVPDGPLQRPSGAALAEGVAWAWDRWSRDPAALAPDRRSLTVPSGQLLLMWKTSGQTAVGFAARADAFATRWLADLKPRFDVLHVRLALTDSEGDAVLGRPPDARGRPAIRLASDSALPWTIQVFSSSDESGAFDSRRTLLVAGMSLLLALILTGTWFIGHAVSRELATARLQADFVSAVSHEFRTPLTTLCQLSELLMRGRVTSEQDRGQYYEFLHNESHRLRRLVEALLDFGRLQAGTMPITLTEMDAGSLVRQFAGEFVESQQMRDHHFDIDTSESATIRGDRDMLRLVFWNLFENAVKYSPDAKTVWIGLARRGRNVEIAVRDEGAGIPRGEHRLIFDTFVRGRAARESNIRGTGIGLAMARQIVREHGGDITLESEPGKGSTFSVILPEARPQT